MIDLSLLDEENGGQEETDQPINFDDKDLMIEIRQTILESYIVPGCIIEMNTDLYLVFAILPATDKLIRRTMVKKLTGANCAIDFGWDKVPLRAEANLISGLRYCIDMVYMPQYDTGYYDDDDVNMQLIIEHCREGEYAVWRRDK